MPIRLYDSSGDENERRRLSPSSIVSGIVVSNCDLLMQNKVLVRIPATNEEILARVSSPGAGPDRGWFSPPQPNDEVLVALVQESPADSFIIGGLWNNQDRSPASMPTDTQTRRIIRTGLVGGVGHEIDFDDAQQAITITSSTQHKVTIGAEKIELAAPMGTVKITMDTLQQTISISAGAGPLGRIELSAGQISLQGTDVEISGSATTRISGGMVTIN